MAKRVAGQVCRVPIVFFQAEDGIRDNLVTGVQTCALPICDKRPSIDPFLSIGVRLGPRSSVDVGWSRAAGRERSTVAYQRSLPIGPGVGARVQFDPRARDRKSVV